jgi:hypothetical protein
VTSFVTRSFRDVGFRDFLERVLTHY